MAIAYRDARDKWAEALNLASGPVAINPQGVADARNAAEAAKEDFLQLAAARTRLDGSK